MKRNRAMIIAFLTPAVVALLLVFLYPTLRTTLMSFFAAKSISDPVSSWTFNGLGNFTDLMKSSLYRTAMMNILNIWLWGGVLIFIMAVLFAVILTSGVKFKSFWRAVIYLPNVVSAVAMGTMWLHYVYNPNYGLLHSIFKLFPGEFFDNLSTTQYTSPDMLFTSLLIAYSFGMIGYFMLIFMAGIERIPVDFYEAATLEGAGLIRKFTRITLPLLKDVFRTNLVLWSINAVGFFVWSQVFSPLNPEPGTVTPMVYMYQLVFGKNMVYTEPNTGQGAAVGVMLTVFVLLAFTLFTILFKDDKSVEL